jgi:putative spermidine/putrescine transport system permease protein
MEAVADTMADVRVALRRDARHRTATALILVLPLALFLLLTFLVPIGALLWRAVDNPEIARAVPRTVAALARWDAASPPPDAAYAAFVADLQALREQTDAGMLARRLNTEVGGARSLVMNAWRAQPLPAAVNDAAVRAQLIALDPRWEEPWIWQAIAKNGARLTPDYLLASVDLKRATDGSVVTMEADRSAFRRILARTFGIAALVTSIALVLAYPLAWWLSTMAPRRANVLLIVVLVPFWTSILVRVAAWIVLLQSGGLVNQALRGIGLIDQPLALLFNRTGVVIAMVHILLPFMVLPLYSVMKRIPRDYVRAAVSLGSHPLAAFLRVYVPQTYAGVAAGSLLVFILAIGYYVTPALLGGPEDQMLSYSVAQYANVHLDWGMACALGSVLLAATLVLYAIYRRLARMEPALA